MFDVFLVKSLKNGKPTFKSRFSLKESKDKLNLSDLRRKMGKQAFAAQFLNDPMIEKVGKRDV